MNERPKTSLSWIVLTGLVLTAVPLSAVAMQSARLAGGEALALPANIINLQDDGLVPIIDISTPLSTLELSALSGDNHFAPRDIAFVFLKRSGKMWYPYAILKSEPVLSTLPADSVMLRAQVASITQGIMTLNYSFDRISPSQSFIKGIAAQDAANLSIGLSVSEDGRTSLSALYLGETRFDQRVNLKSVLRGRSTTSATSAPPK